MTTPTTDTLEPTETPKAHPQCKLCRDGTYATQTMQSFVEDGWPWDPYCDPCGASMASVLKDAQKRVAEIRLLPPPPTGKAAPKPVKPKVEPAPKPTKGSKGSKASTKVTETPPPPAAVEAPKPPVEVRPRMSLAEAMRPTAPKAVPVPPPVPPPAPVAPPASAKSVKNALREAARDVEGYDLLTMLGMKR